jgi:hypothetical protein
VHAVTGEAFDRAGVDRCADRVFVHHLTVANEPLFAAPDGPYRIGPLAWRHADCCVDRGVCAGGGVFSGVRRAGRRVRITAGFPTVGAVAHDAREPPADDNADVEAAGGGARHGRSDR